MNAGVTAMAEVSVDRASLPIDQGTWESKALTALGNWFGGATSFPQGRGVWRDDARGGTLIHDRPIVIFCYTSDEAITQNRENLLRFLDQLGMETNQGAVGFVIDQTYLEMTFPPRAGT